MGTMGKGFILWISGSAGQSTGGTLVLWNFAIADLPMVCGDNV